MPKQVTETVAHDTPSQPESVLRRGGVREALLALHETVADGQTGILDEVVKRSAGSVYDPGELIEPSIKISPRGFSQKRYGGCLSWQPSQRGRLLESAQRAAPTATLRSLLEDPSSAAVEWLSRSARFFTCAAYDFDARSYKLYQFRHRPVHYLEDLDLVREQQQLSALSYIRSLELHMDDSSNSRLPMYFKLRSENAGNPLAETTDESRRKPLPARALISPDFTPHPQLSPRLLAGMPNDSAIRTQLYLLLADFVPSQQPVIKFEVPTFLNEKGAARELTAGEFRDLDYGVCINLLEPGPVRPLEAWKSAVLDIAGAFNCLPRARAWCERMANFGCFLSYLGIGRDSVTFYYRTSAPILRRARRPV